MLFQDALLLGEELDEADAFDTTVVRSHLVVLFLTKRLHAKRRLGWHSSVCGICCVHVTFA